MEGVVEYVGLLQCVQLRQRVLVLALNTATYMVKSRGSGGSGSGHSSYSSGDSRNSSGKVGFYL